MSLFNAKSEPPTVVNESQYVPYRFGLPKNSTLTGVSEYFVYIVKRSEEDTPEKILQIFQAHNGRLISATLYPGNDAKNEFVLDCFLDTTKMDCQPDDLLILFRKFKFVKRAERVKAAGKLQSSFLFPFVGTGNKRSLVIDSEVLLTAESAIASRDSSAGKLISAELYELGRARGLALSLEFASNQVPANKLDEYVTEAAKSYLRASGWGILGYSNEGDVFTVNLTEPPVIQASNGSLFVGGSYLKGLIAGLLEFKHTNGVKLAVTHESYHKEKKIFSLYYANERLVEDLAQAKTTESTELEMDDAEEATIATSDFAEEPPRTEQFRIMGLPKEAPVQQTMPNQEMKKLDSDLGNLDIVRKILAVSKPGALKVTLMHSAKLTLIEAKEYIQKMINADLLAVKKVQGTDTIIYQTTPKGLDYLDVHERLSSMLEQDFPDTRILRKVQS